MARTTTTATGCKMVALHGHGVYWRNGSDFTDAVFTEGDTRRKAEEALGAFGAGFEVRPFHIQYGRAYTCAA